MDWTLFHQLQMFEPKPLVLYLQLTSYRSYLAKRFVKRGQWIYSIF